MWFKSKSSEDQKREKFREIENMFNGNEEMISFEKATWLSSRGNHHGNQGNFDEAIKDFEEAISIKKDHLPSYLGLAVACESKGEKNKATAVIESAPDVMMVNGKVLATKKDMLDASI